MTTEERLISEIENIIRGLPDPPLEILKINHKIAEETGGESYLIKFPDSRVIMVIFLEEKNIVFYVKKQEGFDQAKRISWSIEANFPIFSCKVSGTANCPA